MGEGGGNDIYIRSDEYAWIPARLVEQDKTTAKVAIPQYESEEFIMSDGGKGAVGFKSAIVKLSDYVNQVLPLQNVNSSGTLKEVDDMVDLSYLHEVSCDISRQTHYGYNHCIAILNDLSSDECSKCSFFSDSYYFYNPVGCYSV